MEIADYVNKYDIDVLLVSETFLKPNINFYISNYKVYRLDRDTGTKGGVAIIIKSSIKHKIMNSYNLKIIEALQISVQTPRGNISLITTYHAGANKNFEAFREDLVTLTSSKHRYILCGDLNDIGIGIARNPTLQERFCLIKCKQDYFRFIFQIPLLTFQPIQKRLLLP